MDQSIFVKQFIDFNKATFNNMLSAIDMFQQQSEVMTASLLDQAAWVPDEGKKAIKDWVNSVKKGREDFKKVVDDNFSKVEDFFKGAK
ncbi:MAG: hypothetical protein J7K32_00905 [Deltaproteobacteria bacterium]|nr:hypothetical protein [Deltaproteobacteria bacterium]